MNVEGYVPENPHGKKTLCVAESLKACGDRVRPARHLASFSDGECYLEIEPK